MNALYFLHFENGEAFREDLWYGYMPAKQNVRFALSGRVLSLNCL